jgi:hypothetical protein
LSSCSRSASCWALAAALSGDGSSLRNSSACVCSASMLPLQSFILVSASVYAFTAFWYSSSLLGICFSSACLR